MRDFRAGVLAAVLPLLFIVCAPAQAHELGANRVEITVADDGRYDLAIVSNPEALLARLELLRGDAADLRQQAGTESERLAGLAETLLAHLHVRADDVETKPEILPGFHRMPAAEGTGADEWAVRLHGRLPTGAERITWQCGFFYGSYAVVVRAPAVSVQWTYASERTAGMSLDGLRQPSTVATTWRFLREGFLHILPLGLDHVLFVLGVFLLSRRLRHGEGAQLHQHGAQPPAQEKDPQHEQHMIEAERKNVQDRGLQVQRQDV